MSCGRNKRVIKFASTSTLQILALLIDFVAELPCFARVGASIAIGNLSIRKNLVLRSAYNVRTYKLSGRGRVHFIREAKGNQNTRLAFVLKKKLTSVEATNGVVPVRIFCLTDVTKDFGKYMLWFNFILGLNYSFFCFFGLVMYDNELKTNKKIKPRIKVDHNMYFVSFAFSLVTLLVTL